MGANRRQLIMVVVTDPFAREQLALTKAAAVARRSGARLLLFNAFMMPQPVTDMPASSREQIIAAAIRQRQERMQALATHLRLESEARCIVRWDYPIHEAIIRQVRRSRPDLLMTESHRHGRLARMLLANTDWQLMRDCPCPLWFVRSATLARQPRLLVAVDPRHTHAKPARLDDRLLQAARSLVRRMGGGRVTLVHAYEEPSSAVPALLMEPIALPAPALSLRQLGTVANNAVARLARKHGIAPAQCIVRTGEAGAVLAAEARRLRADVLLMGAVSRSLPARPVIGHTAERVIDHVDCDVFVVKPAGFKSPARRSPVEPGKRR